ncbi:epimerase, partial [Candidatus Marinamargulisbacteria bacterium SCGC AG-343-D04]
MVRDPSRLKLHRFDASRITVHQGDMERIEDLAPIIKTCHYVIHTATIWGGGDFANVINVDKTKTLFEATDDTLCERIIYFSTASILGKGDKPVPAAGKYGGGYVRSKYAAHQMIPSLPMAHKITTLFPTLVFGGDHDFPQSHITSGVYPNLNILRFIRYIYVDGGFHFLHADDIAKISVHLMLNPHEKSEYILGCKPQTAKDTLSTLAS